MSASRQVLRHRPLSPRYWRRRRLLGRRLIGAGLFDPALKSVSLARHLDAGQRERLRAFVTVFLDEKRFEWAGGLAPEPALAALIALQACIPVLELGIEWYDEWTVVIVYPGDFVVRHRYLDEAGVEHETRDVLSGEAWQRGIVVLAREQVLAAAAGDDPGGNVVIHECAHQLDLLDGDANGMPPLPEGMRGADWHRAFSDAWHELGRRLEQGREPGLDPYAATDPGEFFAVASEHFFADPAGLERHYPAVHRQLAAFYGAGAGGRR